MNKQEKKRLLQYRYFALLLIILPTVVLALEFGEVKLYSYLGEPLDAEVELLGAENYDPERIIVSLASEQEFKRVALDRPLLLSQLQFQVLRTAANPVIRMTSSEPLSQPSLEFLINLSWPEGKEVRGYTVLLNEASPGTHPLHERRTKAPEISQSAIDKALAELTAEQPAPHQPGFEKLFEENLENAKSKAPIMTVVSMASATKPETSGIAQELGSEAIDVSTEKLPLAKIPQNFQNSEGWLIIPSSELLAAELPGIVNTQTLSESAFAQSASSQTSLSPHTPTLPVTLPTELVPSVKAYQLPLLTELKSSFTIDKNHSIMIGIAFGILGLCVLLIVGLARRKKIKVNDVPSMESQASSQFGYPSTHVSIVGTAPQSTSSINEEEKISGLHEEFKLNAPLPHEMSMKIELARHYMDIGDDENAFILLEDVSQRGTDWEKQAALRLLSDARSSINKA